MCWWSCWLCRHLTLSRVLPSRPVTSLYVVENWQEMWSSIGTTLGPWSMTGSYFDACIIIIMACIEIIIHNPSSEGPHPTTMSMGRGGMDFRLISGMHLPASWLRLSTKPVHQEQPLLPALEVCYLLLSPVAVDQISWSQKMAWQTSLLCHLTRERNQDVPGARKSLSKPPARAIQQGEGQGLLSWLK